MAINTKSLKNLKNFKKGKDPRRNTKGANISITGIVRKKLTSKPKGEDKKTYADLIVQKIFDKALKDGDIRMLEKIWAYIDGMPKEQKEVSGGLKIMIEDYGTSEDKTTNKAKGIQEGG